MMNLYSTWQQRLLAPLLSILFLFVFSTKQLSAQCNPNALYDNMVGGYHGAIVKQPDGSFKVWGEYMLNNGGLADHATVPQLINTANYPLLTGTPLFASLGGNNDHQAIVLTTTGLFAWGFENMMLATAITTSTTFEKLTINGETDGLPAGINPTDVRMVFTSNQLLAILTNSGAVYVISQIAEARGAGAAASSTQWYQVTTSDPGFPAISNITAIRGNGRGSMMALSSTGVLYTWGASTFLGNNTAALARNRATPMTLPTGVLGTDIKMIGMTARTIADPSSHYLLTFSGSLYGLGENTNRQLGDFTTTDRTGWVNVKKTATTNFTDCIFFSPNEHDLAYGAVNAIDANNDLLNWGVNNSSNLGRGGVSGPVDPGAPLGFTPGTDNAFITETGGHISLYVKEGSIKYCYLGHKVNGSMGDGTIAAATLTSYECNATGDAQVCGATSFDAGDAPNSYEGNGGIDYCTHNISVANNNTLFLGTVKPTANNMNLKNVAAYADNTGTNGDNVQEDGLPATVNGFFIGNGSYSLSVSVTNTTGGNANLYSWIDWNRDGDFSDAGESASAVVTSGSTSATLNYPSVPAGIIPAVKYYIRLRFTTATLTSPLGYAPDGEVEDYFMKAVQPTPDVNATWVNVAVTGNVSTNDGAPAGSTYGTPVAIPGNPGPAVPTMNADGTYSFTSAVPGVFYFNVPVCPPGQSVGCPLVQLKITVLDFNAANNPPVANTDIAITPLNTPVTLNTLANDKSGNAATSLNPASVIVTVAPSNGTTSVNPATGQITYTPNPGFVGIDVLTYEVCDNSTPTPQCTTSQQIITVLPTIGGDNTTEAADDYNNTALNTPVSASVLTNDNDPNGNTQTVTPQNTTIPGVGTLVLNSDGTYTFTPVTSYVGPAAFPYQVCDNGTPVACTNATLYILVSGFSTLPVTLLQFTGERKSNDIIVRWKTENENNASHYEVEYSTDAINFTKGGMVVANDLLSSNNYQFVLFNYTLPLYYIRLKSVDKDSRFKYSGIIRVTMNGKLAIGLAVLPNPVTDKLNIRISSDVAASSDLKLINNLGQIIYRQRNSVVKGENLITINNLNNLPNGVYTLQVLINQEVLTAKIFKN